MGQFIRISLRILKRVPTRPYINNIIVDGPKIDYRQTEYTELSRVRRYILEYIRNLNKILLTIEYTRATVLGKKL